MLFGRKFKRSIKPINSLSLILITNSRNWRLYLIKLCSNDNLKTQRHNRVSTACHLKGHSKHRFESTSGQHLNGVFVNKTCTVFKRRVPARDVRLFEPKLWRRQTDRVVCEGNFWRLLKSILSIKHSRNVYHSVWNYGGYGSKLGDGDQSSGDRKPSVSVYRRLCLI